MSCVEDLVVPGADVAPEGYMTINFALQVPDMNQVQTKAVDPDGGGVQKMTVFCFDENDLFITTVTADIVTRTIRNARAGAHPEGGQGASPTRPVQTW